MASVIHHIKNVLILPSFIMVIRLKDAVDINVLFALHYISSLLCVVSRYTYIFLQCILHYIDFSSPQPSFYFQGNSIYIFPTTDDSVLHQAKEVAEEAKHSGQYTDTNTFRLKCKECGSTITGEDEAMAHAKKTGHSKFEEIHHN